MQDVQGEIGDMSKSRQGWGQGWQKFDQSEPSNRAGLVRFVGFGRLCSNAKSTYNKYKSQITSLQR